MQDGDSLPLLIAFNSVSLDDYGRDLSLSIIPMLFGCHKYMVMYPSFCVSLSEYHDDSRVSL